MPGEYFEARERALLGTRYDVLYAAPCAVRRGVTVNGLRCAPPVSYTHLTLPTT